MAGIKKRLESYRIGDDWKSNFKYVDYNNVSNSLEAILSKKELEKVYDRFGNRVGAAAKWKPLTKDEQIFRIIVLMETQMQLLAESLVPLGDYEADLAESKVFVGKNPPPKFNHVPAPTN